MANPACSNINSNGTYIDVRLGEEEYAQAAVMEAIKDASRPVAGDGSGTYRKWLNVPPATFVRCFRSARAAGEICPEQGLVRAQQGRVHRLWPEHQKA